MLRLVIKSCGLQLKASLILLDDGFHVFKSKDLFCIGKRLIPKKLNKENEQKVTAFILFITVNEKLIFVMHNTLNKS